MARTPSKPIGIRELKAHLSAHLRRVKAGAVLIVAEHGKPICRIVPEGIPESVRVEHLLQTGLIAWNGRKLGKHTPEARPEGKKTVADLVIEDRE
jgi:prevent-host-death family protein